MNVKTAIAQYQSAISSNVPALFFFFLSKNIVDLLKHASRFPQHHTLNLKLLIGPPEEVICVCFQSSRSLQIVW